LSFGKVTVGSSSALNASLNATIASVTVSSASSSSSEFVLSGISFPATIAAGQSEPITVTFTPNAQGTATATLTFMSDASNGPTVLSLTGSGKAPPPHWADLTWDAASGAVSYNVYRKLLTDESYTQINSGDPTAAYTDNNVTAGATYDYVVTALNAENQESGYSNVAQVTIPTP
jgi:Abnormal spindle-like microcephaly-assoc'd, ASPM-SPD-2-Hydin